MAGFDFEVECERISCGYANDVLRFVQKRAADWGCSLRYGSRKPGTIEGEVDGALLSMQALASALVSDLQAFAAAPRSDLPKPARDRVCLSILRSFFEGLDAIELTVADVADRFSASPNSYRFDVGRATHLNGIVRDLRFALISYRNGRYPPTQLTEQMHTAVGALLRAAFRRPAGKASFPSLVAQAKKQGLISRENADVLSELNRLRRNAKHKGQGVAIATMNRVLPQVIDACHRLARRAREETV